MSKTPYFPFYASDWLGSNRRACMSLEEQGAYINLLARQWEEPTCSLPDDDVVLARLSELGEGWLKNGCPLVRVCFPKHPALEGRIANSRLLQVRAERDAWIAKSRVGGRKSAAAKKLRKAKGGSRLVSTKRQPKANSPSPSPSPNSNTPSRPPGETLAFDPLKVEFPEGLDTPAFRDAWADWVKHRREIRKKLTETSVDLQLKELAGMGADRAIDTIRHTIKKGWTGLVAPDDSKGPSQHRKGRVYE